MKYSTDKQSGNGWKINGVISLLFLKESIQTMWLYVQTRNLLHRIILHASWLLAINQSFSFRGLLIFLLKELFNLPFNPISQSNPKANDSYCMLCRWTQSRWNWWNEWRDSIHISITSRSWKCGSGSNIFNELYYIICLKKTQN